MRVFRSLSVHNSILFLCESHSSGSLREGTRSKTRARSAIIGAAAAMRTSGLAIFLLLFSSAAFSQTSPTASSPDAAGLYVENCARCHGDQGQGISGVISIAAPPLKAEHDRDQVIAMIRNGKDIMPSFEPLLSQQQIEMIAGYVVQHLATIPLEAGDLNEGGSLFRVYCAPCHGTSARGGAMAFAGVNAPSLVDKTPETIAATIRWGPGPMPAFPASTISDEQLDSIVAYVRYIQNPPNPGGTPMEYYGSVAEGFMAWIAAALLVGSTWWIEKKGKG